MNSTVLSSSIDNGFVAIKCEKEHQFIVAYTKDHSKTWCEECKNHSIETKAQEYKQREQSEEERKEKEQKRLFEESLKEVQRQQARQVSSFASLQDQVYYEHSVQKA